MKLWLKRLDFEVPAGIRSPGELARFELDNALPGISAELREQADYEDFYLATEEEAEESLAGAVQFLNAVREYLTANGVLS